MRVCQDHWRVILEFGEEYPEIITNKFTNHLQGKTKLKSLWDQLCMRLNSLGHGSRNVEEWKKTLADWKSKTKKKASQNIKEYEKTGGGPSCAIPLTSFEERLIALMGKTSVYGDGTVEIGIIVALKYVMSLINIICVGIKKRTQLHNVVNENIVDQFEQVDHMEHDDFQELNDVIIEEVILDHNYTQNHIIDDTNTESFENKKPKNSNMSNKSKIKLKKRTTESMHEEILQLLESMNNNISDIGVSLRDIATSLKVISEKMNPRQQ